MNPELIPSPDMLGIPAKPLPVLVLMNVTLAAHWIFIGGAFGATCIVLLNTLRRTHQDAAAKINHTILIFLPFTLSMGVTLGIAPLLFVQILYGNFFYSANVLIAMWWLLIIPLVIGNMYLFYVAKNHLQARERLGPALPAIMVAVFVVVASTLVSNATLIQTPQAWESVWRFHGAALFFGDAVVPRLLFALFGLLTVGAMFVAWMGKTGLISDEEAAGHAVGVGLQTALASALLQVVAGGGWIVSLPADQRRTLLGGGPITLFAAGATTAMIVTAVLLFAARNSHSRAAMSAGTILYSFALVAIAFARDGLRQATLAPYFKLSDVAVNPQWGPFVLFLVFLAIACGAVMALVRLARPARIKHDSNS